MDSPAATSLVDRVSRVDGPAANLLVRLLVGGVFLSEGIQEFLYPEALGVGRFAKGAVAKTL